MNEHYIYVYLDQRKKGFWSFEDKTFDYQPFYIGKGKYFRINHHLQPKSRSDNSIKSNIINSIEKEMNELPIHYKLYENLSFEEANEIEKRMIRFFGRIDKKTGILSNMTDGGEGFKNVIFTDDTRKKMSEAKIGKSCGKNNGKSKIVEQYDLNGNFIKKYDSLTEAANENSLDLKNISHCCRGESKSAYGFIWKYNGTAYKPIIKAERPDKRKKVYQYDLEGNFVKEWISVSEACKITKTKHVCSVCLNKTKQSGGFMWRYEFLGEKIEPYKRDNLKIDKNRRRTIACFKNEEKIKEFKNIKEATNWLGLKNSGNISAACNGRAISAYGYTWKFIN
jgi:hypothetical protein